MIYQNTGPSGGKLAFLLGCSVKMPHGNQRYAADRWSQETTRDGVLPIHINYGCAKKFLPEGCINYNSEDVQDKVYCFGIFDQHKIPHPKIITDPANYDNFFLGRKNNSSQGNGITRFKPRSENWNKRGCDFFVEYIDVEKEFRVHVIKGMAVIEFNKDFSKCRDFIHSKQFGSKLHFGKLDHPQRYDILDASIKAVHACGLDYGAVDIISEKETGRWMILEVNSAPSLAHEIGYIYAEHFARLLDVKINKWWEITGTGEIIDNRKVLETCIFKPYSEQQPPVKKKKPLFWRRRI